MIEFFCTALEIFFFTLSFEDLNVELKKRNNFFIFLLRSNMHESNCHVFGDLQNTSILARHLLRTMNREKQRMKVMTKENKESMLCFCVWVINITLLINRLLN